MKLLSFLVLTTMFTATGYEAGAANEKAPCKERIREGTPWAIPPMFPPGRKELSLVQCVQRYPEGLQVCTYINMEQDKCLAMVDAPSQDKWMLVPYDCRTGEPLSEQSL